MPNKRIVIIVLFMALAIGSQTTSCCPVALAIWKAKPLPYRLISFIGMAISPKMAEAQEATAPEGSRGANKIEYKSEDLKDPFQEEKIEIKEEPQVEVETKPLPALQIQGVVWGGSLPQAIINNKVVRGGDTIEGVRITDINKNGVTVFFQNRQYNLSTVSPINPQGPKNNP